MHPWTGYDLTKRKSLSEELKAELSRSYMVSLRYNWKNVLEGHCMVVDPSSGSATSLPAYTILQAGEVVDTQVVPIPKKYLGRGGMIAHRLHAIGAHLFDKFRDTTFDLLAVELLYHTPQENTVMSSFQKLNMSIGTVHGAIDAKYRIVVPPWEWHKRRPEGYEKSDLNDVQLLAQTLIEDSNTFKPDGGSDNG